MPTRPTQPDFNPTRANPAPARGTPSRMLVPAVLLAAGLGLAACNTMEGVGEDVQSGGRAIEKTAEDVKR